MASSLADNRELAALFLKIATVVTTVPVGRVDDWKWNGPTADFSVFCADLGVPRLAERVAKLADSLGR